MNLQPEHIQFTAIPDDTPPGGMRVVDTPTGIRAVWRHPDNNPGGRYRGITITIDCELERSQHRNKQLALTMLEWAIAELPEPKP